MRAYHFETRVTTINTSVQICAILGHVLITRVDKRYYCKVNHECTVNDNYIVIIVNEHLVNY